jgi:hypothetical protein
MEALRRAYAAGYRAPLLQGPTGSVARLKGRRVVVLVHRRELKLGCWTRSAGTMTLRTISTGTLERYAGLNPDVLAAIGLTIADVAIHVLGNRRWTALPVRPLIDSEGQLLRDEAGKIKYVAPFRWIAHGIARRFSALCIDLLLTHHRNALDDACPASLGEDPTP